MKYTQHAALYLLFFSRKKSGRRTRKNQTKTGLGNLITHTHRMFFSLNDDRSNKWKKQTKRKCKQFKIIIDGGLNILLFAAKSTILA